MREKRERIPFLPSLSLFRPLPAFPPFCLPEGVPNAAELAEQIKELRAANTVEAAPERTAKRQVSAEEPVTKMILNRPKVEIDVQHVNGEVARRMVDRIKRVAEWAR